MPSQFDVVPNPDPDEASRRPYLLVLQSNLVSGLASTAVAPLIVRDMMKGAERLNPVLVVDEREYWLATHELFAIERRVLTSPVANLESQRYAIIGALDFLFTGF